MSHGRRYIPESPLCPGMYVKRITVGPLATNCYVVSRGSECVVIDPGGYFHEANVVIKAVGGKKVVGILLTHGHADHYALWAGLHHRFHAPVYMNPEDMEIAEISAGWGRTAFGYPVEPPGAFEPLVEGMLILGLRVIETPGHTPGSVCLVGPDAIFTGDTLFRGSHGRTDLPGGSEELMGKSLTRLASYRGYRVYPGHGPPTTVDAEADWMGDFA